MCIICALLRSVFVYKGFASDMINLVISTYLHICFPNRECLACKSSVVIIWYITNIIVSLAVYLIKDHNN